MYLYTNEELKALPMGDLSALVDASWKVYGAAANYRDRNWNDSTMAVCELFHNEYWRMNNIYLDRCVAIDRLWRSIIALAAEYEMDMKHDIANMWIELALMAGCANPKLDTDYLFFMERYTVNLIWQKSDNPGQDVKAFQHEYWRKKSNTAKGKVCRKWCSAIWTFGIPDFKV